MNGILFTATATVKNFDEASIMQKQLDKIDGLKYIYETIQKTNGKAKRKKRATIGKAEIYAVENAIVNHPNWDDESIGKATNVSSTTVSRIKNKQHKLQQKVAKK